MTTLIARELMTAKILTVREDMTVAELATFLAENKITGAGVRDDRGRLVGVVSLTDVAAHAGERTDIVRGEFQPDFYVRGWEEIYNREEVAGLHVEHAEVLVRDVMNPAVYSVPEETSVAEVAEKMLRGQLHRIFVTRGDDPVGIISTSDFLKLFVALADPGANFESTVAIAARHADSALGRESDVLDPP